MRGRTRFMAPMALIIAVLVLATAAWAASARQEAGSPTLLRIPATAAVTTWDPIKSFSTEVLYMANIYEPLLWANPQGSATSFRPGLAKSWSKSDGGRT